MRRPPPRHARNRSSPSSRDACEVGDLNEEGAPPKREMTIACNWSVLEEAWPKGPEFPDPIRTAAGSAWAVLRRTVMTKGGASSMAGWTVGVSRAARLDRTTRAR